MSSWIRGIQILFVFFFVVSLSIDAQRQLRPEDLPTEKVFEDWTNCEEGDATSIDLPGKLSQDLKIGSIQQTGNMSKDMRSNFAVLPGIVSEDETRSILALLKGVGLDQDPDTVDGMATEEIFVDNQELREGRSSKGKAIENSKTLESRQILRRRLKEIMDPILDERITPFVRARYPDQCDRPGGRKCTPCYSLVRRYRRGQRISHGSHRDGHAIATVVTSLTDYGSDYRGGLYLASVSADRHFLDLHRGDAVVHQSDLLHGVKVFPTPEGRMERWSWVLWFRDSETCEEHGHEWFKDCAEAGNPTCEFNYATKVGTIPGLSSEQIANQVLYWNHRAARHGHAQACVKLARAYLKFLPSKLPYNASKATRLYKRAIRMAADPDAHYGLASLLLKRGDDFDEDTTSENIEIVIRHLESAATGGHAYAMFNLGIAHLYGYSSRDKRPNLDLAMEWFEASGLPEGFAAIAMRNQAISTHTNEAFSSFAGKKARRFGYGSAWRRKARIHTGSGGAGGVDLNLPWPEGGGVAIPPMW
eukprot:g4971.t1